MAAIRTYYLYSFIWLKPDDDPVIATTNFIHQRTMCDSLNYNLMSISSEWQWSWLLATTTTSTVTKMKKWKRVIKLRLRFKPEHESHGLECSFHSLSVIFYANACRIRLIFILVACEFGLIAVNSETIRMDRYRPTETEKNINYLVQSF